MSRTAARTSTRRGTLTVVLGTLALLVTGGFLHPELAASGRDAPAAWHADLTKAPTVLAADHEPATARLALDMLEAADLGPGWFDEAHPNPSAVRTAQGRATDGATARFVKARRTPTGWTTEGVVTQEAHVFASEPAARVYLLRRETETSAACGCTRTWRAMDGISVVFTTRGTARRASFALGGTAFTVSSSDTAAAVFSQAVQAAVRRAAS